MCQKGEFPLRQRLVAQIELDQPPQMGHAVEINVAAREAVVIGHVMDDGGFHADAGARLIQLNLECAVGADRDEDVGIWMDQCAFELEIEHIDDVFAVGQEKAGFGPE